MIMEKVCDPLFSKKVGSSHDANYIQCNESSNQPWFDQECRNYRKLFYLALKHIGAISLLLIRQVL